MSWPLWILLLALLAAGVLLVRRLRPLPPPPMDPGPADEFGPEIEQAIARYEKAQLAYALRRLVILGGHPLSLLTTLEATYGKAVGVPWLTLRGKWDDGARDWIRLWMTGRGMPFREEAPALQQLEQELERVIGARAQAILDEALTERY